MTIGFDLGHDLGLEFSRSNIESAISRPRMNGPIATKQKANISNELYASNVTIGFELGHDLDYGFQGQIWNLIYLSHRWFDCHKMKRTHIEWTEGLNDHQVWPWPWSWKVRCKDLPDSDRGDFISGRAVDSSSLHRLHDYCSMQITIMVWIWKVIGEHNTPWHMQASTFRNDMFSDTGIQIS